jgi:hypothetical protein
MPSMVLRTWIILLFLLLGSAVAAQDRGAFTRGSVVTAAGDTLRGELLASRDAALVDAVTFRQARGAVATAYAPPDLREFRFAESGRRFVSRSIVRHGDSDPSPTFLAVAIGGPLNLLVLHGDREAYYLEGEDFPLERLRPVVQDVDFVMLTAETGRPHVVTLARALHRCPEVQRRAAFTPFKLGDLTRIVREHNECLGAAIEQPRRGAEFAVTPRVGLAISRLGNVNLGTSDARLAPYISLSAELRLPDLSAGTHVFAELAVTRKGTPDDGYFPATWAPIREDFDRTNIGLRGGVRQNVLPTRTRPYVGGGILVGWLTGDQRTVATLTGYEPPRMEAGGFGEMGLSHRTYGLGELLVGLRYEYATMGVGRPFGGMPEGTRVSSRMLLLSAGLRF